VVLLVLLVLLLQLLLLPVLPVLPVLLLQLLLLQLMLLHPLLLFHLHLLLDLPKLSAMVVVLLVSPMNLTRVYSFVWICATDNTMPDLACSSLDLLEVQVV